MAKSVKKATAAASNEQVPKPGANMRVVKASPAKTTLAKKTILSAVLAVRKAK